MHAEKQFLSKLVSSSGLQPTAICFAHILLQTQNKILYPEGNINTNTNTYTNFNTNTNILILIIL